MQNKAEGSEDLRFFPEESSSSAEEDLGYWSDAGSSDASTPTWQFLPDVCLRHVFRFLSDADRRDAALACRRWHNVMHSPSLWRHRCFSFNGSRLPGSQPAMTYAHHLGVYLQRLEVDITPPRRYTAAKRLEWQLRGLFSELVGVKAPLRSMSIEGLELNRSCWSPILRSSVLDCLARLLRGTSMLSSVTMRGMHTCICQGVELLWALSHCQRCLPPNSKTFSLNLDAFFSPTESVFLDSRFPHVLFHLRNLTHLHLSYHCLSDELLAALQHRHYNRDGGALQTIHLLCSVSESHYQVVNGGSWASLVSSCPDLEVKVTVLQLTNVNSLARMLLREIPLTEFKMTAFYSPNEMWTASPLIQHVLPRYTRSLQCLTLDLSNFRETLDDEVLGLVNACERLQQLKVRAFVDLSFIQKLMDIRLTRRTSLNKIRVTVFSMSDEIEEQQEHLKAILDSYQNLPPQLNVFAYVLNYI